MANVFELEAVIKLNDSEFQSGVKGAEKSGSSLATKFKSVLGTAGKVAGVTLAAVGAAAVGTTKYLLDGAAATAEYGDHIDKMSQKMGISAQAYQEWDAILQHSGSSIDSMQRGMMTLSQAAANGSDAFQKLGLSQEQVASMSQEDLFSAVITGLQGMESGSERAALAQKLLGGAAKELGPLLNTSAEDTQAMRDRLHELGGVMSDDAVKSAAAYQDSLQDMKTAFQGLQRGLFTEFMPGITTVMDGLTAVFSGDSDTGIGMISDGISNIVTNISEKMPEFINLGMGIISALGTAIIDNLPAIVEAGMMLLVNLITGLLEAIPMLVEKAPEIIQALINGFKAAWPALKAAGIKLIQMVGEGLSAAWGWLKGKASEVWDGIKASVAASWEGIKAKASSIWEGIKATISNVWSGITSTVSARVNAVKSAISNSFNAAKTTVSNIMDGIKEKIQAAVDFIKNIFNFSWSLPPLKLPHFSIVGSFSLNPPSVPKLSVTWNRKALSEPFMFSNATIFGAGEAGDEVLYGKSNLMEDIRTASAEQNGALAAKMDAILGILAQYLPEALARPVVLDTGALVGGIGTRMDNQLGEIDGYGRRGLSLA